MPGSTRRTAGSRCHSSPRRPSTSRRRPPANSTRRSSSKPTPRAANYFSHVNRRTIVAPLVAIPIVHTDRTAAEHPRRPTVGRPWRSLHVTLPTFRAHTRLPLCQTWISRPRTRFGAARMSSGDLIGPSGKLWPFAATCQLQGAPRRRHGVHLGTPPCAPATTIIRRVRRRRRRRRRLRYNPCVSPDVVVRQDRCCQPRRRMRWR